MEWVCSVLGDTVDSSLVMVIFCAVSGGDGDDGGEW